MENTEARFIFETDLASPKCGLTARYCSFLGSLADTEEGPNLFIPSPKELSEWDAQIVAWTCHGEFASGLYFIETRPNVYYFGGVVSNYRYRNHGLTCKLVEYSVISLSRRGAQLFELDVRVRAGCPNQAAYRLFVKQGFSTVGTRRVVLKGRQYERHLYNSTEADGNSILSLRMSARAFGVNYSKEVA